MYQKMIAYLCIISTMNISVQHCAQKSTMNISDQDCAQKSEQVEPKVKRVNWSAVCESMRSSFEQPSYDIPQQVQGFYGIRAVYRCNNEHSVRVPGENNDAYINLIYTLLQAMSEPSGLHRNYSASYNAANHRMRYDSVVICVAQRQIEAAGIMFTDCMQECVKFHLKKGSTIIVEPSWIDGDCQVTLFQPKRECVTER